MAASIRRIMPVTEIGRQWLSHCGCASRFYLNMRSLRSLEYLSKHSYWEKRYKDQPSDMKFDWFLDSRQTLDLIIDDVHHIYQAKCAAGLPKEKTPVSFLDLGCGTSDVALSILKHCPTPVQLCLLDFVHEALEYQRQLLDTSKDKVADLSFINTVCADVLHLPFCANSFDMILDKGTMDALLKDSSEGKRKTQCMMEEVMRTLTMGGRFLQISDEDPDTRLPFLEDIRKKCLHALAFNRPDPSKFVDNDWNDSLPLIKSEQTVDLSSHKDKESVLSEDRDIGKCFHTVASGQLAPSRSLHNMNSSHLSRKENLQTSGASSYKCIESVIKSDRIKIDKILSEKEKDVDENVFQKSEETFDCDKHASQLNCEQLNSELFTKDITSGKTLPVDWVSYCDQEQFSSWSFKVITVNSGNEYFMFCLDKRRG